MGGSLCNPCPAHNEEGMMVMMMMMMKNFIPQESSFFPQGFWVLSESQVYSRVSQEELPKSKGAYNQSLHLKPYAFIFYYLSPTLNPWFLLQGKGLQHPLDHRESLQGHSHLHLRSLNFKILPCPWLQACGWWSLVHQHDPTPVARRTVLLPLQWSQSSQTRAIS